MLRRLTFAVAIALISASAFAAGLPGITAITPNHGTVYGGDLVTIAFENFSINCPVCSPPFAVGVTFGGVASPDVRIDGSGNAIAAVTPPHPAGGPVDVKLTNFNNDSIAVAGGFTYEFAIQPSSLETILIPAPLVPSSKPLPGAGGSLWVSELHVRNGGNAAALTFLQDALCVLCDPPPPLPSLGVGETRELQAGDASLPGHIVVVQKAESPFYAFSLRIRDVSRSAQNEGTEIPVVREAELRSTRPIELLNVPLNATSRAALRIFATEDEPSIAALAYVNVVSMTRPEIDSAFLRLELSHVQRLAAGPPRAPGYVAVNDLRAATGLPEGRYRVEVLPQTYRAGWAFVAVTNNETQLVTAIAPR